MGVKDYQKQQDKNHNQQQLNFDYFEGQHVDCLNRNNQWLNGEIIQIDQDQLKIHFSGTDYNEWIDIYSDRIQLQWIRGMSFQCNNRLDIYNQKSQWLEAIVIQIDQAKILIHYQGQDSTLDEWIPFNSKRISEVGSYSNSMGQAKLKLQNKSKINQSQLKSQEEWFKKELIKKDMYIQEVASDGNCLFRAISDQIYGTDQYYNEIRQICVDYIEIEKYFFEPFIENHQFQNYMMNKRNDGVWGDDIEIQALSEIYQMSIEIYSYSNVPMKTFHEKQYTQNNPFRLSYHGLSHYNSIRKNNQQFQPQQFGIVEQQALSKAIQRKSIENPLQESLEQSRSQFLKEINRDVKLAFEESLQQYRSSIQFKEEMDVIKNAVQESRQIFEQKDIQDQIINSLKEETKQQIIEQENNEIYKQLIEHTINDTKSHLPPAIQKVIEQGFSLEMVQQATIYVGDQDPDLIINFICQNLF